MVSPSTTMGCLSENTPNLGVFMLGLLRTTPPQQYAPLAPARLFISRLCVGNNEMYVVNDSTV